MEIEGGRERKMEREGERERKIERIDKEKAS